jgi:hypothetical protein
MPISRKSDLTGPAMVFVTITIIDWTPVMADSKCAQIVVEQLQETSIAMDVSVVDAYACSYFNRIKGHKIACELYAGL